MSKDEIRIMLVDDHEMILDSLSLLFQFMEGIKVEVVEKDSRKVMDHLEKNEIDILVTDFNMPYVDGIQVTKQVKEKYPGIKVLILTVNENRQDIQNAFQVGASGYIMKKAGRKELEKAIHEVMDGKMYFGQDAMKAMFSPDTNGPTATMVDKQKITTLTNREIEIVALLAQEMSSSDIAKKLFISVGTVETHRHNILKKLGVKTTVGVVKFAVKVGLV